MELKLTGYQEELYDEYVAYKQTMGIGRKTTIVLLTLKNGFEIVGSSACVDPKDYKFKVGEYYALVDALNKLSEYVGFMKQQYISMREVVNSIKKDEDNLSREVYTNILLKDNE